MWGQVDIEAIEVRRVDFCVCLCAVLCTCVVSCMCVVFVCLLFCVCVCCFICVVSCGGGIFVSMKA